MARRNPPLHELLTISPDDRDSDWENSFLHQIPTAKVKLLFQDAKPGPDNWPYLFVENGGESDEPLTDVIDWLAPRGIGLAINPQKATPDFVFTYGMVWNFRERGVFISPSPEREAGSFQLKPGQQIRTGPVTESYLPNYVRGILKQFWLDQGVFAPKVLLVSEDQKNYDLCFSLESIGLPPEEERMGIAEAVSWFLPSHYSISLISEKSIDGFEAL